MLPLKLGSTLLRAKAHCGDRLSMPHDYTEDQLVEQPAIGLFAELGWATVSAFQNLHQTRDLRLLSGQLELQTSAE